MSSNVENLGTIKGKYLAIEVKEGFEEFNLGDTDIRIKTVERTGVAKYTNFSHHCKIVGAYPNSRIDVGTHFWTRHEIVDDSFDGSCVASSLAGETVYALREENILFVGDNITTATSYDASNPWVLVRTKGMEKEEKGELVVFSGPNKNIGKVVNGVGVLNEGDFITWLPGGRVEYWQNEVQYWAVNVSRITTLNGKPHGLFYELDLFDDFEWEKGGVILKGRDAARMKYNIKTRKGEHLAILNNPELEHHGKVAIARQSKKGVKYSNDIIALID
jgi:hypothetical protein